MNVASMPILVCMQDDDLEVSDDDNDEIDDDDEEEEEEEDEDEAELEAMALAEGRAQAKVDAIYNAEALQEKLEDIGDDFTLQEYLN